MTARGCGGAVLFACGALLAVLSFMFTIEMETFVGLRDNLAGFAVFFGVLAAGFTAGGYALFGRRSRGALVVALCIGAALAWRAYTVAPMLHCSDYNSVGRNDDGSYDCYDR
ncbi:hypothetical protein OG883_24270 [Streptomyces sp. NBC_01142]|uniref:hypothetical protein n=1 Tax=Streptomyces sp. NBC_01142 TaxID=2975865 RepID=UPI0022540C79|nr:hypothetical protein [Streptomyces sp. NBC_01142]MCX4822949.1 hypothetical protein [Streptomyces sp. NBC_01142]